MIISTAHRISNVEEYYFSKKLTQIAQLNADGHDIINLGIGSPDLLPHPTVIEKLKEASHNKIANKYQSYRGIPELRKAFSDWYKKHFDVDLNPENEILPLIGSKEGIMHISMSFLNPGDQVLVPNPGYPTYSSVSKLTGAEIVNYDLTNDNNWLPDFEKMEESDLSKVKIMWINYPHMPTGAKATIDLYERLVTFGMKHNILICHDNPYGFILNEKPISLMQIDGAKECCLELNSLSKAYNMAGWRVGAIAGDSSYLDAILRFKSNMDSGMFRPIQEAAIEALGLGNDCFDYNNNHYLSRRKWAWKIMDYFGCSYDTDAAGMFVWGKVPEHIENVESWMNLVLDESRVFITPGFIFGSQGDRYIRISLCSTEHNLEQAFIRIKEKFKS